MKWVRARVKAIVRWLGDRGIYWPLLWRFRRGIYEVTVPGIRPAPGVPAVLALSPMRFRSDLEVMAATGRVRIFAMDKPTLNILTNLYYDGLAPRYPDLHNAPEGSRIRVVQKRFQAYLEGLLTILYDERGIGVVLSAAYYYAQEQDIAMVSQRLGYPWVVLHKENLATAPAHRKVFEDLCRVMNGFKGERVVVHNMPMREALIDCGFAEPAKVSALGCLRMDGFLDRIAAGAPAVTSRRKKVVLFSFFHTNGLYSFTTDPFPPKRDFGFVRLFEDCHAEFARLALERPDVDFVIKPKWGGGAWQREIELAVRMTGVELRDIANLVVSPDANVHDLILASDVVVGFGSTTLLEAGIAGKPVVMPLFHEATHEQFKDHLVLTENASDLFLVAHSPEEYRTLIVASLDNSHVSSGMMMKRAEAFERFVTPLAGGAVARYVAEIEAIAAA